jgi:hypothetical protein
VTVTTMMTATNTHIHLENYFDYLIIFPRTSKYFCLH